MPLTCETADGICLHADDFGPADDVPPVVCLPGLTRNARDFAHLAKALSRDDRVGRGRRVVVLESRGRGRSGRAPAETYTLVQELADLTAALDEWGIEKADFVGTSRGGLLIMLLAATAPIRIDRAVLNDIGPTIERSGLGRIAATVGARMSYPSMAELAASLKRASCEQFPRLTDNQWIRYAEQLASLGPDGSVHLDYDAALADGFTDFSASDATPDFWPAFAALLDHPVLVVRGANSDILSAATVEGMRRRHHNLSAIVVSDEGHAPLLWDRFSVETIKAFLQ
ncbi:alpha/beta hydrolase [Acuticoccus sp. M5D2P5]|uniref:alpha/beta fold hydrolase n=1 Tax=Acuticoccus kalidii TaxID=2910977 RepID=UPI001F3A57E8|nr:alpha/beta hydrolase [Acuticoccus kalidii]MCF3936630.1 alpha/beta hydrolase [Acuticoccus kalidii]